MSGTVEHSDRPVITRQLAAQAIVNYFLANADAGNHAANDELVAELARRQGQTRHEFAASQSVLSAIPQDAGKAPRY